MNGADPLGSQGVWTQGYLAVYHMQQNPTGNGALIWDSTVNRNYGKPQGSMNLNSLVNGKMGDALSFDDDTNDFIAIENPQGFGDNEQLSISAWANFNSLMDDNTLIGKYDYPNNKREWILFFESSSNELIYRGSSDGSATDQRKYGYAGTGVWNHFNINFDNGTTTIYENSVSQGLTGTGAASILQSNGNILIGASGNTSSSTAHMDGEIDEVRIASEVRSPNWVTTEYNNFNSPNTFFTVNGTVQTSTDDSLPKLLRVIPRQAKTKVPRRHPLRMVFNENVTVGSGNITIYQNNGSLFETISVGSGQVTGSGTSQITITPSTNFTAGETYYINIDRGAFEDGALDAFEGMDKSRSWSFTIQDGRGKLPH